MNFCRSAVLREVSTGFSEMVSQLFSRDRMKKVVGARKSAIFLVCDSCGVAVSSVAKKTSVEVTVAPIDVHTTSTYRMHVTDDEK